MNLSQDKQRAKMRAMTRANLWGQEFMRRNLQIKYAVEMILQIIFRLMLAANKLTFSPSVSAAKSTALGEKESLTSAQALNLKDQLLYQQ